MRVKIEKYVMPCRVVVAENTEDADNLLIKSSMQAGFKSVNCTKIKQGGYVLLDFGIELCGGVAVTVRSTSVKYPDYAKCRIVFGESVMEALSTINVKNATNDHAVRDEILTVSELSTLYFGRTGFRFVKLEAVHGDITVKKVRAETDIKDIEYKGSFRSSDELLNKIWQTGAYTVHLNMHDYVWDGVKRDRLVWIGDTNPEIATIKSVFGYDESVPNSLDFVKEENLPSEWMVYPSYSMWWIIDHYEWYMQNGDLDWVENAARIDEVVTDGMKDIHGDCGNYCYTKYRHSLCHGWASGPTAFLSQKLGGIEILEPGCRKVRVNPVLADLDWMEITYPTPFGGIKISAAKKDGKTEFEVSAPKEIEIVNV